MRLAPLLALTLLAVQAAPDPDWSAPRNTLSNYLPRWSPDGKRLAFYQRTPEGWRMHVMDAGGGSLRRLESGAKNDYGPAWSPDGRWLVFDSDRDGGRHIYRMHIDERRVESLTEGPSRDVMPSWSPDGQSIAFVSNREAGPQVWIMDRDGGCARRITRGLPAGSILRPAWSPDAKRLAFAATDAATGQRRVYVVGVDGARLVPITAPGAAANPSWSPDGRRLVFDATPDGRDESSQGQFELFTVSADGTDLRRLTTDRVNDWGASWSPDGRQIAFSRGMNDQYEIYTVPAGGGTPRRLTHLVYR